MASAAIWAERVAEWRQSGLSAVKFAVGRDFSSHQLCYWSVKMRRAEGAVGGPTPSTAEAARVRVARVVRVAKGGTSGGPVLVEVHGVRLVLPGGFDRQTFCAVLDELDARAGRGGRR
jgi:hypothetical protein